MKNKILSLIIILILLSSDIAFAQFVDVKEEKTQDLFGRELTGESIFVEVAGYEPTVVPANVLNDQDVPVYVYLRGTTIGGLALGQESLESAPLYGLPNIKNMQVRATGRGSEYISGIRYIPPLRYQFTSDNRFYDLGYLIVNLQRIQKESEIPDIIDLNLTTRIEFELENAYGDFGAQDLVLGENLNEELWKQDPDGNFWGRTGYVRVLRVEGDKVTIQVYDGLLRSLGRFTLKEGDETSPLLIRYGQRLRTNRFRVRLNKISDEEDRARVRLVKDGKIEYIWVEEDSPIYYGSKWVVKDIRKYFGSDGVYEEVVLKDNEGNYEYLYRKYEEEANYVKYIDPNEFNKVEDKVKITQDNINQYGYGNIIEKYSTNLIPVNLIKAVITAESEGVPNAQAEDSTAKGLMQILDGTASSVASKLGVINYDIFNSETNIMFGFYYLNEQYERFGTYELALAAYYWGPDNVDKYCKSGGSYSYSACDFDHPNGDKVKQYVEDVMDYYAYLNGNYEIGVYQVEGGGQEDVCSNINTIELKDVKEGTDYRKLLCTSIYELKDYLYQNENDLNKDLVYYYLGLNYKELGDYSSAKDYFEKVEIDSEYYGLALEQLKELNLRISENLEEVPLYLEDENVELVLKEVKLSKEADTKIRIKTGYNGDIFLKTDENDGYRIGSLLKYGSSGIDSKWYVKEIGPDYVLVAAKFEGEEIEREEKLYLGKSGKALRIDDDEHFIALLEDIESYKEAYLTILPGSGRAISETEFLVHIPIEDYGISFSDEQIDKQINWTQKSIEKLTGIINELDNIIQIGNGACWGFWGFFTLINLFTPDLRKARNLVMNGADGKSGIKEICSENIGYGKDYQNYDECIYVNRKEINDLIEKSKESLEESKKGSINLEKYQYIDSSGKTRYLATESDLRNYKRLEYLNGELTDVQGDFSKEFKSQVNGLYNLEKEKLENYEDAVNYANDVISNINIEDLNERYRLWKQVYDSKIAEAVTEINIPSDIYTIQHVGEDKDSKLYYYKIEDKKPTKVILDKLTISGYIEELKKIEPQDNSVIKEIERLERLSDQDAHAVTEEGFYLYKEIESGNIIASQVNVEGVRTTYADDATAEFYVDGRPKFYPIGDGDYVEVLEYYVSGAPKTVAKWNVGPDGLLGTEDDISLLSDSELRLPENVNEEKRLKQQVSRAGLCKDGDTIRPSGVGRQFLCSTEKSQLEQQLSSKQCTDVFSIWQCQILFNFCDPVMCPASRFNLAGKYQVNNVVQTGLIGSLVLGMPNWIGLSKSGQIIPPICLTGVSSSAKAYRSMLQGYSECLQVSKEEGENVGICEKIRSVFWCELVWREASAIGKALINIRNTKDVYDYLGSGGGGEYTFLQQQASYISDSSSFFTKEYAKNAFAAYKARSTAEIGTEICESFIGAKGPNFGEFFDELTRPESPPQFTAYFDEKPWSTEAGLTTLNKEFGLSGYEEQSLYNVYYHIYAGEDQDVRYTVFLRDDFGNVAYVTERVGSALGFIPRGGFADKNIDFLGRPGYKEICVVINGNAECGFGKTSTSFALNRISDALVTSDSYKRVETKEECVPEYIGPSTNIAGVFVVLPTNVPGVTTQNGIVRLCSVKNPGEGVNPEDYESVGTCGTDELGRNLGDCWIDLRTVTRAIESTDYKENISERYGIGLTISDDLAKKRFEILEKEINEYFAIGKEDVSYNLEKGDVEKNINNINNLVEIRHEVKDIQEKDGVGSYRDLATYNFGEYGKLSKIRIAQVYYSIGSYLKDKIQQKNLESRKPVELYFKNEMGFYILFDLNNANIENEDLLLDNFNDVLKEFPSVKEIKIIGYASEEGDEEYNQKLSEARAKSVYDILNNDANRFKYGYFDIGFSYEGKGETIEFGDLVENRRVVVEFITESETIVKEGDGCCTIASGGYGVAVTYCKVDKDICERSTGSLGWVERGYCEGNKCNPPST